MIYAILTHDRQVIESRIRLPFFLASIFFLFSLSLAGCGKPSPKSVDIAPGIVFRRDETVGVQTVSVDLQTAAVRPVFVAENIERRGNNFVGDCKTVREWSEKYGAIVGMNATFFGNTYDEVGRRKQIVGLLVREGRVVAPFSFIKASDTSGAKYTRSALGFGVDGKPQIAWVTGTMSAPPKRYNSAVSPPEGAPWQTLFAAGCGPRLFAAGSKYIADRDERLVSPGKLNRAFVAYDWDRGGPQHMVLGRADAMEFSEIADYLTVLFRREFNSAPEEAMCMDGGPSAQLVYRNSGSIEDAEPTGVLVPTALLLLPK
jgi:hypothetical protein